MSDPRGRGIPWLVPRPPLRKMKRIDPSPREDFALSLCPGDALGELPEQLGLGSLLMEEWVERCHEEQAQFNSPALFCEVKLNEALQMTAAMPRPNTFMTSLCFCLMEKMADVVGPYRTAMLVLLGEIVRSVYTNYDEMVEAAEDNELESELAAGGSVGPGVGPGGGVGGGGGQKGGRGGGGRGGGGGGGGGGGRGIGGGGFGAGMSRSTAAPQWLHEAVPRQMGADVLFQGKPYFAELEDIRIQVHTQGHTHTHTHTHTTHETMNIH